MNDLFVCNKQTRSILFRAIKYRIGKISGGYGNEMFELRRR